MIDTPEVPNGPAAHDVAASMRARALATSPAMAVDQTTVLARGRRARLTRSIVGGVSVLAVAGLAVFTVAQLWSGHPTPPAEHSAPLVLPDPVPTWIAEHDQAPIVRELIPGVLATVKPGPWRLTDGTTMAVSGLGIGTGSTASSWALAAVSADEVNSRLSSLDTPMIFDPADPWVGDAAVELVFVAGGERDPGVSFLGWGEAVDASSYYALGSTRYVGNSLRTGTVSGVLHQSVFAASIPTNLVDPAVRLCFASMTSLIEGTTVNVVCVPDVPLFLAPTHAAHQMLLVSSDLTDDDGAPMEVVGGVLTARDGTEMPFWLCNESSNQNGAEPEVPRVRDVCRAPAGELTD